jgi:integrase/recombinase XerD
VKKRKRRTFERADVQKLLNTAERMELDHVVAFIRIAASTGLRLDEVLHLRWGDIDPAEGRIEVRAKEWEERRFDRTSRRYFMRRCFWSPKSHQERAVWVEPRSGLFEFLRRYRAAQERNRDGDWIFQGRAGQRLTTIAKPLRDVFRWAGLYEKGTLAHTFRHSVATALLGSGVDIETVRDWMGHQQVTTTALYLHASDDRKRKAARQLRLVS